MENARKLTPLFSYWIYQFYRSFFSTGLLLVLHEQMHVVMKQEFCGETKA